MQNRNKRAPAYAAIVALSSLLAACQTVDGLFERPQPAQSEKKQPQPRKAVVAKLPLRGAQTASVNAEETRDSEKAKALRAQALEQMNSGAIDAAAANLKRAQELDPGNEAIRKDLRRATRIQSTVSARAQ